jgi:hypothetical protein
MASLIQALLQIFVILLLVDGSEASLMSKWRQWSQDWKGGMASYGSSGGEASSRISQWRQSNSRGKGGIAASKTKSSKSTNKKNGMNKKGKDGKKSKGMMMKGRGGRPLPPAPSMPTAPPVGASTLVPTTEPITFATTTPTPPPSAEVTMTTEPTIDPTIVPVTCAPTTGVCSTTTEELDAVLATSQPGDVVSLCGGNSGIEDALVTQSGITLCCLTDDCSLQTTGGISLLRVTGENFTIRNIDFIDGGGSLRGGNMAIIANGTHLIEDCIFETAQGSSMENVFVQTFGDLIVRRSSFLNFVGEGSGLTVFDATKVIIEDSVFSGNERFGLFTQWSSNLRDLSTEGQDIEISNSRFEQNGAEGYFASNLGTLPRLSLLQNEFFDHDLSATSFCCSEEYGDLVLSGNSGARNGVSTSCQGFFFFVLFGSETCLPLDVELRNGTSS